MVMANEKQVSYWNEIAGPKWVKIDAEMDSRFQEITRVLLDAANASPGTKLLEIGCGTGLVSALLAAQVGEDGKVTGVDISEPMLNVSRGNYGNIKNLRFLNADAQVFDFGAASYELIVSRFGMMFFDDPVSAFKNMIKALIDGGRLCFVCWASLAENPHWRLPFDVVAERLGAPEPKPARSPGPMALAEPGYIAEILTSAGFREIMVTPTPVMIIGESIDDETRIASLLGPSGALMDEKKASEEMRRNLRQNISLVLKQFGRADGIKLPATINLITALK
jgi:SAM-dependent methyltransferase